MRRFFNPLQMVGRTLVGHIMTPTATGSRRWRLGLLLGSILLSLQVPPGSGRLTKSLGRVAGQWVQLCAGCWQSNQARSAHLSLETALRASQRASSHTMTGYMAYGPWPQGMAVTALPPATWACGNELNLWLLSRRHLHPLAVPVAMVRATALTAWPPRALVLLEPAP
jgi:hypothetical protein